MKKVLILIFFVLGFFLVSNSKANAENLANCLKINLSTQVVSGQWPGGSLSVSCGGDTGPSGCTGNTTSVVPGGSVTLDRCSCPPYANGCLSIPNTDLTSKGCTGDWVGSYCGTNGNVINPQLKISCPVPPPQCPGGKSFCGDSNGGGVSCPAGQIPDYLGNQGYDDWCALPVNGGGPKPYCYRCIPGPTNTPTKTPTPTGVPPTATATLPPSVPTNPPSVPTNPPNVPTNPPSVPTNPPSVPTSQPKPTNTPPPVPTPTPDFNNAMCKCDQMNVGQISLGQPIKIEAFAKVEGQDTAKAVVKGMKFRIYEGNASQGRVSELPEKADQPVTIIDNTPSLVRYRAEWTANPTLKVNEEYRIVATPDCQAKTAAAIQKDNQRVVLAARDENVGFFGQIINFFAGLFGRGSETEDKGVQIAEEQGSTIQAIGDFFKPRQNKRGNQLQLDTFTPAQMEKEACNIVKFKFSFTQ